MLKFLGEYLHYRHLWEKVKERSGFEQKEELGCGAVLTRPPPTLQGALKLGWPFRVIASGLKGLCLYTL